MSICNAFGVAPPNALFSAIAQGSLEAARAALEGGVDVTETDTYDTSSLSFACMESSNAALVKLLLESGAEVDRANQDGRAPLHHACREGALDVVRLLLEHGAAIDMADDGASTPLLHACLRGHLGVVRLLVEHGAAVNQTNKAGTTPLLLSCKRGHLELVQLFSSHGADRGPPNGGMLSQAEHEAKSAGQTRVVQWLQQTHPNYKDRDCMGTYHRKRARTQEAEDDS